MTPKEKAKELVDKMWIYALPNANGSWKNAKQCALIAVDEIDKAIDFDFMEVQNLDREHFYWEQVRVEINNI